MIRNLNFQSHMSSAILGLTSTCSVFITITQAISIKLLMTILVRSFYDSKLIRLSPQLKPRNVIKQTEYFVIKYT